MKNANQRSSRFKRGKTPKLELTDRDLVILRSLQKYRVLTTEHLLALTETQGRRALNRRLRELYDAGFIDRPKAQLLTLAYAEKRPLIYALGSKGADLLAKRFGDTMPEIDWTEKNRRIKERFIEHRLGISDYMVKMELTCRASENMRLITKDEILSEAPEPTRKSKHPFRWKTRISQNGERQEIALVPDEFFGIHYTDKPAGRDKHYFFLELDRGTMPLIRSDTRQTSIWRKMLSYQDTNNRNLHFKYFGISSFRVLFITTGQERTENMERLWKRHESGKKMLFRFKADALTCTHLAILLE